MMAAHQGYEEIVQELVNNGSDIDIADRFGKKAYDWAKNQNIFYILTSAGMERRMKESSILQEKHNIKEESENKSPKKTIKKPKKGTSGKKKTKPESLENYLSSFFK